MKKRLSISLIGCGNWGQYILRDLKELKCEVTVVCLSAESVERARKYGADHIVNAIDQINNPDGIIIASPTSTHLNVIESVLKFDVPIFVEKPLGTNLAHALSIAAKAGEKIFVMDKWRYHHGIEKLAMIARNKELGEVIGLNIKQLSWGCPHTDVDFIDILLPHALTISYEILGEIPEPQTSYLLKRQNQAVGLHALLGKHPWINISIMINSHKYNREIILECSSGLAVLNDAYSNEIEIYRSDAVQEKYLALSEKIPFANEPPLLREIHEFLDYLKGGKEPKSNVRMGLKVMEAIMKVRDLAAERAATHALAELSPSV